MVIEETTEDAIRVAENTTEGTPAPVTVDQRVKEARIATGREVSEKVEIVVEAFHQHATETILQVPVELLKRREMVIVDLDLALTQDLSHHVEVSLNAPTVETREEIEVPHQDLQKDRKTTATKRRQDKLRKLQISSIATSKSKILRVRMISKSHKKWLIRKTESILSSKVK